MSEIKLISRRIIEVKNISFDRNIAIIQSIVVACETYTKYSVYHSKMKKFKKLSKNDLFDLELMFI